jgi:hypothetical protein
MIAVNPDIFVSNRHFVKAHRDALVDVVNRGTGVKKGTPECLSLYCDSILKSGSRSDKVGEQDMDRLLDNIIRIVSLLQDKDIFVNFYRDHLARRLLDARSESVDAETSMITKLKMLQGSLYTNKIEGMLTDFAAASDGKEFMMFCQSQSAGGAVMKAPSFEFSAKVLTLANWPSFRKIPCLLPQEMQMFVDVYEAFYSDTQSGRKLMWPHSQGSIEMKASFEKKYTLLLNPLQAVVLMAFNGDTIQKSFLALREETDMPEDVLKKVLHSFTNTPGLKMKILNKTSSGGSSGTTHSEADKKRDTAISPTDIFTLNESFKNVTQKFRVPMAAIDEETGSNQNITEERKYMIDASVVRIMKVLRNMLKFFYFDFHIIFNFLIFFFCRGNRFVRLWTITP